MDTKMPQQQQQTKLKPIKPMPVGKFTNPNVLYNANGKAYKSKTSGIGWGGEKPKSKKKKAVAPSLSKIQKSISKTMGYK